MNLYTLAQNAATTGVFAPVTYQQVGFSSATFQAVGQTTAGSGATVVDIEVSNDNVNWIILGTITLTLGTVTTSDGFASGAPWAYTRAEVRSISGTGASVSVFMGV